MRKTYTRYSNDQLAKVVATSNTIAEVLRKLGIEKLSGGMHSHISRRIKKLNLDTSHMSGQSWAKGKESKRKLQPEEVFVVDRLNGYREKWYILKRALLESGIEYKCSICGILPKWNGKDLVLEMDHINGNCLDNRKNNLRFLCPNCHSQV